MFYRSQFQRSDTKFLLHLKESEYRFSQRNDNFAHVMDVGKL